MTLMDAPAFDARRARMRRTLAIGGVVLFVFAFFGTIFWMLEIPWAFWHWPSDHRVNQFMSAVESGDMNKAYALWNNDPNWQQHPQQYQPYDMTAFQKDWGPSNEDYGAIKSHTIFISHRVGNGVVIGLYINGVKKPLFLRVDSKTKTIGFSPVELSREP
jgi:hypothetical protein